MPQQTGSSKKGRGNAAQIINQKRRGSITPASEANNGDHVEEDPLTPEEEAADLRYYVCFHANLETPQMTQIYLIIKPVMACIILSILWVKFTAPAV